MSDFPQPNQGVLPLFVSSLSECGVGLEMKNIGQGDSFAITWVANQAIYIPFAIPWQYPVNRVWWVNGSTITSTNVDFGIYTAGGVRIYSTTSTAMAGASTLQYVTPATPFVLGAGKYYFAWTCDNTTSRAWGSTPTLSSGVNGGLLCQSSALPLPATMTPIRYIATGHQLCGITRTASGF